MLQPSLLPRNARDRRRKKGARPKRFRGPPFGPRGPFPGGVLSFLLIRERRSAPFFRLRAHFGPKSKKWRKVGFRGTKSRGPKSSESRRPGAEDRSLRDHSRDEASRRPFRRPTRRCVPRRKGRVSESAGFAGGRPRSPDTCRLSPRRSAFLRGRRSSACEERYSRRSRGPFWDLRRWEGFAAPDMGSSEGGGPPMFEEKHVLRKSCIACGGMYAEVGLPRVWSAGDTHPH